MGSRQGNANKEVLACLLYRFTSLGSKGTQTRPVLGCTAKGDLSKWLMPWLIGVRGGRVVGLVGLGE